MRSRSADPSTLAAGDIAEVPGLPWSVRLGHASGPRPAMEIYQAGILLDVVIAMPLAPGLLRGARRAAWGGQPRCVAWGRLPGDGSGISVAFSHGRFRPVVQDADVAAVAGLFWVAAADGWFDHAVATGRRGAERRRVRTWRP